MPRGNERGMRTGSHNCHSVDLASLLIALFSGNYDRIRSWWSHMSPLWEESLWYFIFFKQRTGLTSWWNGGWLLLWLWRFTDIFRFSTWVSSTLRYLSHLWRPIFFFSRQSAEITIADIYWLKLNCLGNLTHSSDAFHLDICFCCCFATRDEGSLMWH